MRIRKIDIEQARGIKGIIEMRYYEQYTCKDLACIAGINVTKLQACFKSITNMSLYEYRTRVRIEKAMYLLENTDLKIDVIARKVGLDRSNLNIQFNKIYSMSPGKWREQQEKRNLALEDQNSMLFQEKNQIACV